LASALRSGQKTLPLQELLSMARSEDRFLADAALSALARSSRTWADSQLGSLPAADKVWGLVALRRNGLSDPKWVRLCWNDSNPELRFECLRWIADGELKEFLPRVEALLADPKLDYRLFEASIATINTLKGTPEAGVTDPATLALRLLQPTTSPSVRAYILRLLPANHEKLTVQQLVQWYRSGHPLLMLETIRTLAMQRRTEAQEVLLEHDRNVHFRDPVGHRVREVATPGFDREMQQECDLRVAVCVERGDDASHGGAEGALAGGERTLHELARRVDVHP
jgi:hypothetical protein